MLKGFKQFTEQTVKPVVFTFGRFNPPTIGHLKLLDKVASIARGKDYRIYASQSNDAKKNPLQYKEKVTFMRKMFPKHGRNIVMDPKIKTVFDIATQLYDEGFNQLNMVVGGDRVAEFEKLLVRYNDQKGRHGYYNFIEGINIISAGRRDPDSEGVEGMSASKMRAAASNGDLKSFQLGLPKGYSDGVNLFNTLRKRMGLREITDFREHVQLKSVSEQRELYARGEIFNISDVVYCLDEEIVIKERKPNYIVATNDKKYWIKDLSEEKNPRIPRKKGQPAGSKKHSDLYTDENPKGTIEVDSFKEYLEAGTKETVSSYKKETPGEEQSEAGLWANIHKRRKSGKRMRKPGEKGAPTKKAFKSASEKKSEPWEKGYERRVVKTTKPEHKEKGYNWRIKGKERNEISIKLYKNKPSYSEFKKQMKRVAGHEFGKG